jgi:hypothetical protein
MTVFACNMSAMSPEQRHRYDALLADLAHAWETRREIANGYEFTVDLGQLPFVEIAEWIALEARCCPFFTFGLETGGESASATLRLTGEDGVKEFIRAEFGFD